MYFCCLTFCLVCAKSLSSLTILHCFSLCKRERIKKLIIYAADKVLKDLSPIEKEPLEVKEAKKYTGGKNVDKLALAFAMMKRRKGPNRNICKKSCQPEERS